MSNEVLQFQLVRGKLEPASRIIAIGGGKGGVGKSFVSSSLAIFLAQLGYKTLAIDLDLGAANLHTWLGEPLSPRGINEFILNTEMPFTEVIQPTQWQNLSMVSGSSEALDMANVDDLQRSRIMSTIFRHKTDFIILDLSAGTHHAALDFFLMAQHKVVVFTPEPSSVENAYRFLKYSFYRKLRRYEHQLNLKEQIDELLAHKGSDGIKSPSDLLRVLVKREPVLGPKLKSLMTDLNFQIMLNQARTRQELDVGLSLQSVCSKYFGFPCDFIGGLEYDNSVWQSLRRKQHLLVANRQSHLYAQLMNIARNLANPKRLKAVV